MIKFFTVLIFLLPIPALSITDLVVKEKLTVYSQPKSNSKKVSQLSKGDVVVISPKSYGSYRKVLVTFNGKRQGGFVLKKDIVLSIVQERTPEEENIMTRKMSFGAAFGLDSTFIQGGQFKASGFPDAKSDNLYGFDLFFDAHFNYPVFDSTIFEASLGKRSISYAGNVNFMSSGGVQNTDVVEKGYFISCFAKFYSKRSSIFFKGIGAEAFYVNNIDITVNGGQSIKYDGDSEVYFAPILGLGWDIQLTDSMFFSPDFRTGAYLTREPMAFFVDFRLSANFIL